MVVANLLLTSDGHASPIGIYVILAFVACLYFWAMILLIVRIEQCIRYKKEIVKLKKKILKLKKNG